MADDHASDQRQADVPYPDAGIRAVAPHVEYVLATQPDEHQQMFAEALRRHVPGRGGDVMNYVLRMVEEGRREGWQEGLREGIREGVMKGRREGELRGQLKTIQGFLGRGVLWSTIEEVTGIDEATFWRLWQQQFDDDTLNA